MLVQLTKSLCVTDTRIISIEKVPVSGPGGRRSVMSTVTVYGRLAPITVEGDWTKKILKAKQVGAIYLDSDHYELRA